MYTRHMFRDVPGVFSVFNFITILVFDMKELVGYVTATLNAVVFLARDDARAIYVADSFMYTRHMCNESTVGGALEILV